MTGHDRYRIESKPEWRPLVSRVERAPADVLHSCLQRLRIHAFEVLSEAGWSGVAAAQVDAASGTDGRDRVKTEAEAADNTYLDASVEAEDLPETDAAHEHVHVLFVVARALSALDNTLEASSDVAVLASAVLDAAYELSVTSPERNASLQRELEAEMRTAG
jgi:hypothetical protein